MWYLLFPLNSVQLPDCVAGLCLLPGGLYPPVLLRDGLHPRLAGRLPRHLHLGLQASANNHFLLAAMLLCRLNCFYFSYNIGFFLLTYLLPCLGMGCCYLQIGLHLYRGDKTILQLVMIPPAAMAKSRKDKKRVSKNTNINIAMKSCYPQTLDFENISHIGIKNMFLVGFPCSQCPKGQISRNKYVRRKLFSVILM